MNSNQVKPTATSPKIFNKSTACELISCRFNESISFIKFMQSFKSLQDGSNNLIYLPLENSFPAGTVLNHVEEGLNSAYNPETRVINGLTYPSFSNELMTGIDNLYNYLTPITVGLLDALTTVRQ